MAYKINDEGVIVEAFSGVLMEQPDGNQIGICMRDNTFEINVLPKGKDTKNWWVVNMETGKIFNMAEMAKLRRGLYVSDDAPTSVNIGDLED